VYVYLLIQVQLWSEVVLPGRLDEAHLRFHRRRVSPELCVEDEQTPRQGTAIGLALCLGLVLIT